MTKRLYLILSIVCWVIVLVIYFQNIRINFNWLFFFKLRLWLATFMFYMSIMSFCLGVFLTLTVKWFLDWNKDMDDWFDL